MLLALLAALPAAAFAADAAPAAADPIAAAQASVAELESCFDDLDYYRADLKKKDAELAKEFKGKVPSAFVFLMNLKRGRVSRQQEACAVLIKRGEAPFAPAEERLKTLDSSKDEYKKGRKSLDELRARLNKALKRFATEPN